VARSAGWGVSHRLRCALRAAARSDDERRAP